MHLYGVLSTLTQQVQFFLFVSLSSYYFSLYFAFDFHILRRFGRRNICCFLLVILKFECDFLKLCGQATRWRLFLAILLVIVCEYMKFKIFGFEFGWSSDSTVS